MHLSTLSNWIRGDFLLVLWTERIVIPVYHCLESLFFYCLIIFFYWRLKQIKLSNRVPGNKKHGKENRLLWRGKPQSAALTFSNAIPMGITNSSLSIQKQECKSRSRLCPILKVLRQPKLVYHYSMYIHKHTLLKSHSQSQLCRKFL